MHPRTLALTLLALLLAAAPSAHARVELKPLDDSPVVAGGLGVVMNTDGNALFAHPLDGGPRRRISVPQLAPGSNGERLDIAYAASPTHVVIQQTVDDIDEPGGARYHDRMLGGPIEGPFHRLDGCGEIVRMPVDVDGSLMAGVAARVVGERRCGSDQPAAAPGEGIVVRDMAARGALRAFVAEPGAVGSVSLAGSYLLYRITLEGEPDRVVVHNWRTGRDAYRVATEGVAMAEAQADGTAIIATNPSNSAPCGAFGRVTVHTPAAPAGRDLPYRPCAPRMRLQDGRLVFARAGSDLGLVDVVVADLQGNARVVDRVTGRLVDADGERAIYEDPGCVGLRHFASRLGDSAGPNDPVRCAVAFRGPRRLRVAARGSVDVPVRCPHGCAVNGRIDTRGREGRRFERRLRSGKGVLRLRAPRKALPGLRRGPIAAVVRLTVNDRDGNTHRQTRRVRLVRR